jgi:lactonase family protein with 7-bladed beta-propeller
MPLLRICFASGLIVMSFFFPAVSIAQAPKLEIVQTLKGGEDGLPKPFIIGYTIVIKGNYLYVGGNNISCFKRDVKTGQVAFLGEVAETKQRLSEAFPKAPKLNTDRKTCILRMAGGRLYAIPQAGTAMAWYDIDEQTGKLTEKGLVECKPCFHAVVSPDQKDLYLLTNPYARSLKMTVTWYHLDADGKPVKSGEAAGKGIGYIDQSPHDGALQISADGKYLYAISGADQSIACLERKPSGEIAYKSTADLAKIGEAEMPDKPNKYAWTSLLLSPDGKWLYANLMKYAKPSFQNIAIFKRNLESGELTLQEAITGEKNVLANRRGWQCVQFLPNGTGFLGHYDLGLWTFQYDAATGRLEYPVQIKETQGYKANVAYDLENGFLYMGGVWIVEGGIQDGFRVLKMKVKK